MMRSFLCTLCLLMAACATTPVVSVPDKLFNDHLFAANKHPIDAHEIFALSAPMKHYIANEIAAELKNNTLQRALFNALYNKTKLQLEYDASNTLNAAETFAARSGNCLSLVIMTAAFAKEIGMSVQYQSVVVAENWSRSGELYFSSGHVNIVLGKRRFEDRMYMDKNHLMTVDFLPPIDTAGQRTNDIEEKTVIAMYMNNRAAEALVRNQIDAAYWWVREGIAHDASFAPAYNTLGVIYSQRHNWEQAEFALNHALRHNPTNTTAMANLFAVLSQMGKLVEAKDLSERLKLAQPVAPFYYFKQGLQAMAAKDYAKAQQLFSKELVRAPDYHEFHYWLGIANLRMGKFNVAQAHLVKAKENSTNQKDLALYSTKLNTLQATVH